jgi:hypothetical protein
MSSRADHLEAARQAGNEVVALRGEIADLILSRYQRAAFATAAAVVPGSPVIAALSACREHLERAASLADSAVQHLNDYQTRI